MFSTQSTYPKDTLHLILDLFHVRSVAVRMASHQLEDGRHDIRHFVTCDITIAVDVVQRKCPLQFLFDGATGQCGQAVYEFLWINEKRKWRNEIYSMGFGEHGKPSAIHLTFSKAY